MGQAVAVSDDATVACTRRSSTRRPSTPIASALNRAASRIAPVPDFPVESGAARLVDERSHESPQNVVDRKRHVARRCEAEPNRRRGVERIRRVLREAGGRGHERRFHVGQFVRHDEPERARVPVYVDRREFVVEAAVQAPFTVEVGCVRTRVDAVSGTGSEVLAGASSEGLMC